MLTIMVIELPVPEGHSKDQLAPLWPLLGAYALSFVSIGIFWNNHHHLMHLVRMIDARVMWANLLLLFWLSLIPFVIRWIGEAKVSAEPVAAFGFIMGMAASAYWLLERMIVRADIAEDGDAPLEIAFGDITRERISLVLYFAGAGLALVEPWLAVAIYIAVAAMWFAPDQRIEEQVEKARGEEGADGLDP